MSNNVLPNLSEWFEVPVGATVPAYTTYTVLWSDGSHTMQKGDSEPFMAESGDIMYFTEKPIEGPKKTLEDVIREGVGGAHTPAEIAKAVEAFYAEQKPLVIIDNDGPGEEWLLYSDGTYDWWHSRQEEFASPYKGYTREEISEEFGIKEERY